MPDENETYGVTVAFDAYNPATRKVEPFNVHVSETDPNLNYNVKRVVNERCGQEDLVLLRITDIAPLLAGEPNAVMRGVNQL